MKTFKLFLIALVTIFTLNSCATAYAQYDDMYVDEYVESNFTYEYIILHGTPYYYNGVISYYYYAGLYYYPYLWEGYWYFKPFRHVHPSGYIYRPTRYHRPMTHLGDLHNKHPHNYGNHHQDGGRGYTHNRPEPNRNVNNPRFQGNQNQRGTQMTAPRVNNNVPRGGSFGNGGLNRGSSGHRGGMPTHGGRR